MINNPPRALSWSNARPCALKIQELIIGSHQEMLYREFCWKFPYIFTKYVMGTFFVKASLVKGFNHDYFLVSFLEIFRRMVIEHLRLLFLHNGKSFESKSKTWKLFNDQCSHHIETSQLICSANQPTDFYMMGTLVVKRLTSISGPHSFFR